MVLSARDSCHRVAFAAITAVAPENDCQADSRGCQSIRELQDHNGAWGNEITGYAMKDTIRALVYGIMILVAALIPPVILLMHYFGH